MIDLRSGCLVVGRFVRRERPPRAGLKRTLRVSVTPRQGWARETERQGELRCRSTSRRVGRSLPALALRFWFLGLPVSRYFRLPVSRASILSPRGFPPQQCAPHRHTSCRAPSDAAAPEPCARALPHRIAHVAVTRGRTLRLQPPRAAHTDRQGLRG